MPPSATRGTDGAGAAEVDDDVAQDREQPGAQRADLRVEALAGAPGADEGLLDRLFGEPGVAERAHREPVQLAGVGGVGLTDVSLAGQCRGIIVLMQSRNHGCTATYAVGGSVPPGHGKDVASAGFTGPGQLRYPRVSRS